jgi:repressor LexA
MGNRIRELRKRLGLKQHHLAEKTGLSIQQISRLELSQRKLSLQYIVQVAAALGVPQSELMPEAATSAAPTSQLTGAHLTRLMVVGAVQAGHYTEASEWDGGDQYPFYAQADDRYPGVERFGLEVRGRSMDLIYPPGSIVICVRFFEIGEEPLPGDIVVALQRDVTGDVEATLKEFLIDDQGRRVLWPRSSAPEFQTPIILPSPSTGFSEDQNGFHVPNGEQPSGHHAGIADISISALVLGGYSKRPERKRG